ncbi:MAG: orotidine-5'-phosphate decarboxylase [Candidatus Binataceae bacterium]
MTQYWPFSGLIRYGALRERLIVSLDTLDRRQALALVDRLARMVGMFRVGRALFVGGGTDFIREIRRRGAEVFLDLRFHDTPHKVVRAATEATRLGVRMFDIHSYGSVALMSRVRTEIVRLCRTEGLRRPQILAVAMVAGLPSLRAKRKPAGAVDGVLELAKTAADASLDGVYTAAQEVARVRAECGRRFIIVTTGVQLRDSLTPGPHCITAADVVRAGADYIVVGGSAWRASEPVRALREITEGIERGLRLPSRGGLELISSRPQ